MLSSSSSISWIPTKNHTCFKLKYESLLRCSQEWHISTVLLMWYKGYTYLTHIVVETRGKGSQSWYQCLLKECAFTQEDVSLRFHHLCYSFQVLRPVLVEPLVSCYSRLLPDPGQLPLNSRHLWNPAAPISLVCCCPATLRGTAGSWRGEETVTSYYQ